MSDSSSLESWVLLEGFLDLVLDVHLESSSSHVIVNIDAEKALDGIIPVLELELLREVSARLRDLLGVGASDHQIVDLTAEHDPTLFILEAVEAGVCGTTFHAQAKPR